MRKITTTKVLALIVSMSLVSFVAGCAHMEKSPPERKTGYAFIHKPLPEASRKVDEARAAGKDKQCPAEFKAASGKVDDAYATYLACRTQEAIAMAQDGINKLNALCPMVAAPMLAPAQTAPAPKAPLATKYCVTLKIEFDFDKSDIKPEFHSEIAKVGDFMNKYPTTTATINGYTDNVGTDDYNLSLSQRRADSVKKYLVEKFGISENRLVTHGYGKSNPVTDNETPEGRALNRRIEALIDCAIVVGDKDQTPPLPDKICIPLKIEFDTGSAEIKPKYNDAIKNVADFMKEYPDTSATIEGYTDNVGSADANLKLSERRALAVKNYLIEKFGISEKRLGHKGFGQANPIADNGTPEGQAKNRRIHAIIDCAFVKK